MTSRRNAPAMSGAALRALPAWSRGQPRRGLPRIARRHQVSAGGSAICGALLPGLVALGNVDGRTIPIAAIDLESDPVQNGRMKSLSRPGGFVTGFRLDRTAMSAKRPLLLCADEVIR